MSEIGKEIIKEGMKNSLNDTGLLSQKTKINIALIGAVLALLLEAIQVFHLNIDANTRLKTKQVEVSESQSKAALDIVAETQKEHLEVMLEQSQIIANQGALLEEYRKTNEEIKNKLQQRNLELKAVKEKCGLI